MIETLNILDFNPVLILLNLCGGLWGVIIAELAIYKTNEKKYSAEDRKGDYAFAFMFVTGWCLFGSPYWWDFMDGRTIWGVTFSIHWHNMATCWVFGMGYELAWELMKNGWKWLSQYVKTNGNKEG